MSSCPNCGYELVLLSSRPKYKCALCSKLYPQIEIDNREFRRRNEIQKQLDFQNYEQERKQELARIRETRKHLGWLFNGFPSYLENKSRKYFPRIKFHKEKWIKTNKLTKGYIIKIKHRLNHYRQRQKRLALLYLKNCNEKLSTSKIFKSPPTFLLSELLEKTKYL